VDDADHSSVGIDDAGNFVVAWEEKNVDGSDTGIRLRRFDAAGSPLSGDVLVNLTTNKHQEYPSVSMDSDGHFIVTWTSENQDGDKQGVYLRAFDPDGTPASGELRANTYTHGEQFISQVSLNDSGRFIVVWEGESAADGKDVSARLYEWPDAGANAAPVAAADNFAVNEDGVLNIAAG
jgi:hypothetical protein